MSVMISNPEVYFKRFIPERNQILKEMENEADHKAIPIVGPLVGELLYILARAMCAKNILELGTATGYSTIYLAGAALENNGRVISIECNPEMAEQALKNLKTAGVRDIVKIRVGDAESLLAREYELFDFIFMDIDKHFYVRLLPRLRQLIKTGGFMLVDNVGFKEAENFNLAIAESNQWRSVNLLSFLPRHSPEKDGLCLALAEKF